MRPSDALQRHRGEIRRVVEQHGACNARVFGSVVHGYDSDDSDLDLLVEPIDGKTTLTSLVRIKRDLESITGVRSMSSLRWRCKSACGRRSLPKPFPYDGEDSARSGSNCRYSPGHCECKPT